MTPPALWLAAAAMLPLMALTAWYDLKYLRIPNWTVLAVLAVFVATGLWGLPLDSFLWRLGAGAAALVIGFGLFQVGVIGGGDAKMAAALVPFVALGDAAVVLAIYAFSTLLLLVLLLVIGRLTAGRQTGWLALDQHDAPTGRRSFPMGLAFATTIGLYLGLLAAAGA